MRRSEAILNGLKTMGHELVRVWQGKRNYCQARVYFTGAYPNPYIEIGGTYGFQVVGDMPEQIIKDCKQILEDWQESQKRPVEADDFPF